MYIIKTQTCDLILLQGVLEQVVRDIAKWLLIKLFTSPTYKMVILLIACFCSVGPETSEMQAPDSEM